MLFPGNSPSGELYPQLCFSQFFLSSFLFFLRWSLLFILLYNTPHLASYTSHTLSHYMPLNELCHLPLPCSGELLPMLQDSLINPYPTRFRLPGRVIHSLLFPKASFINHQTLHTYSLKECFVSFISVNPVMNIVSGIEQVVNDQING